jgi:hypothetical protein
MNLATEIAPADAQLLGWESPTYGDLQPAVSLVYETRSQLPVRFVTAVLTDERCKVESAAGQVVIFYDESEVCRVNLSANATKIKTKPPGAEAQLPESPQNA